MMTAMIRSSALKMTTISTRMWMKSRNVSLFLLILALLEMCSGSSGTTQLPFSSRRSAKYTSTSTSPSSSSSVAAPPVADADASLLFSANKIYQFIPKIPNERRISSLNGRDDEREEQETQTTGGDGDGDGDDSVSNNIDNADNETEGEEQQQRKFKLPRIEVQFICEYDVRRDDGKKEHHGDFNVTSTFHDMYTNVYFPNHQDHMDTQLFTSISMNSISDVTPNHWYYPLCNQTSNSLLATMEVEGYVTFDNNNYYDNKSGVPPISDKNWTQQDIEYHEQKEVERLINVIDEHQLEEYFSTYVCTRLKFFRSKVLVWNPAMDPPPTSYLNDDGHSSSYDRSGNSRSYNYNGQHQSTGHSAPSSPGTGENGIGGGGNSNKYHQRHYYDFEHNMYLLCGGAEEIMAEDEPPDPGFLVVGILVGMFMVGMIGGELSQLPGNRRPTSSISSSSSASGLRGRSTPSRRRGDYDTVQAIEMTIV